MSKNFYSEFITVPALCPCLASAFQDNPFEIQSAAQSMEFYPKLIQTCILFWIFWCTDDGSQSGQTSHFQKWSVFRVMKNSLFQRI